MGELLKMIFFFKKIIIIIFNIEYIVFCVKI